MTDVTEAKDAETTDGEQTRRSSHCYVAPSFDVGDRVRHRASGRIAIVTARLYGCVKHPPLALCALRFDRSECQLEPTGRYHLSFDFDEDAESVDGFLLERADDSAA